MTDIYNVTVVAKEDKEVTLNVKSVYMDARWAENSAGLVLLMLWQGVPYGTSHPLSRELSIEEICDDDWMSTRARGFVRSARITAEYEPDDPNRPDWATSKWIDWQMVVEVSHPAWIEHLTVGQKWETGSVGFLSYQAHPPIVPTPDKVASNEGMFIWVPRECYAQREHCMKLPRLMEMPLYGEAHYMVGDTIAVADLQPGDTSWIGRPIWMQTSSGGTELGYLGHVESPGRPTMPKMGYSSYGYSGTMQTIGTLIPKEKERPNDKLDYTRILRRAHATVTAVACQGTRAVLTLSFPPDGRKHCIKSKTDVLGVLIEPSWDWRDSRLHKDQNKLITAIIQDGVEHNIEGAYRLAGVLPKVAKKYIKSFKLRGHTPKTLLPGLESLSHAEAKAALEEPWPTATLNVEVTDPQWLEHLLDFDAPFSIRDRTLPKPVREKSKPKPKTPPIPDQEAVLWYDHGSTRRSFLIQRFGKTLKRRSGSRHSMPFKRETTQGHCRSVQNAQKRFEEAVKSKINQGYVLLKDGPKVQARVEAVLKAKLERLTPPTIKTCEDPAQKHDDTRRLRANDIINGVGQMGGDRFNYILTTAELAESLKEQTGKSAYIWFTRPSTGTSTSVSRPI